jgi:hypothetical protein
VNVYKYRNHWGSLYQFQAPAAIFEQDVLVLSPSALACYLVLLQLVKQQQRRRARQQYPSEFVTIHVSHRDLSQRAGLGRNIVASGLQQLEERHLLDRETDRRTSIGKFDSNSYLLCDPRDGEALRSKGTNIFQPENIRYFNIPACIVTEVQSEWCLTKMTGSELRVYVSLCWIANRQRDTKFISNRSAIMRLARMASPTFKKASEGLADRRLVWFFPTGSNDVEMRLCDPYTGEPFHLDMVRGQNATTALQRSSSTVRYNRHSL